MTDMPYGPTWLGSDFGTIQVSTGRGIRTIVEYESTRGVINSASEVVIAMPTVTKIDLREHVEFLRHFRDERGRRMPQTTSACALVMSRHGTTTARVKGTTTVQKAVEGRGMEPVYVEHTGGHATKYRYTETKLDRLFSELFKNAECTTAEFRDLNDDGVRSDLSGLSGLSDGWLSTNQINTFWLAIAANTEVKVDRVERLGLHLEDAEGAIRGAVNKIASGLVKSIRKHYSGDRGEENYVALFPINLAGSHHTLARAEYSEDAHHLVVTYFDSCKIEGGKHKCDIIHQAFQRAFVLAHEEKRPDVRDVRFAWPLAQKEGALGYTRSKGVMQKQQDETNCGVFACIATLEAAGGKMPEIHERTIDDSDIRKVRCIIARNHKRAGPERRTSTAGIYVV